MDWVDWPTASPANVRREEVALPIVGEVDRIYWNVPGPIRLNDAGRA
jgi:hypothetical protein